MLTSKKHLDALDELNRSRINLFLQGVLDSRFNDDLQQYVEDPKFREAYEALWELAPLIAKNPVVAGTYLRRMMTMKPEHVGGVLMEAMSHCKGPQK